MIFAIQCALFLTEVRSGAHERGVRGKWGASRAHTHGRLIRLPQPVVRLHFFCAARLSVPRRLSFGGRVPSARPAANSVRTGPLLRLPNSAG